MKVLLFSILLSFHATAQVAPDIMTPVFKTLDNPGSLSDMICTPEDVVKKEQPWCQDLEKSICAVPKTAAKKVEDWDDDLKARFITSLPTTATPIDIARANLQAIQTAEVETAARTTVSVDDQKSLIADVKASLITEVNASGFPKQRADYMVKTISDISLNSATDYVDKLRASFKKLYPRKTDDDIEVDAISYYTDTCGKQGMDANAFYDPEFNAFVLCPGLIQSASEYGSSKADLLTGLAFTVGHEIGHSIDSQKNQYRLNVNPVAYAKMGECYRAETPGLNWEKQRGEIVGDYWGNRVLASRLQSEGKTGQDAHTAAVLAMDGLCGGTGDDAHPAGAFRMNNIMARDPAMRTRLECSPPTVEKPFCSLTGAHPPRPAPARPTKP